MIYLLDTNAWIHFLNHAHSPVGARITQPGEQQIRLNSVSVAELTYGAYKAARTVENLALIRRLENQFESVSFDDRAAESYGILREQLSRKGELIGPYDMLIAAIAIANGFTCVTNNTSEFSRIPHLLLEDWQVP